MTRGAVLATGRGARLQALLDAVFFREIPDFELVAIISPQENSYALTRAKTAGIPGFVVDPDLFPNKESYCTAITNKLKDMDIDLVILCDYNLPLGDVGKRFKNRVIGVVPCLAPAFEGYEGNMYQHLADRGAKIAGATAYFVSEDGGVGPIILQKTVDLDPNMSADAIRARILEDAEWIILPEAVKLFCANKLECVGNYVRITKN